nr:hypothetical protein [Angustibacter aerolatus]
MPFGAHPVVDVDWGRDFAGQARGDRHLRAAPRHAAVLPPGAVHADQLARRGRAPPRRRRPAVPVPRVRPHGPRHHAQGADPRRRRVRRHGDLARPLRRALPRACPTSSAPGSCSRTTTSASPTARCSTSPTAPACRCCSTTCTSTSPTRTSAPGRRSRPSRRRGGRPTACRSSTTYSQDPEKRVGAHAVSLDVDHFTRWLDDVGDRDLDVVLEIKDKEVSALAAAAVVAGHG